MNDYENLGRMRSDSADFLENCESYTLSSEQMARLQEEFDEQMAPLIRESRRKRAQSEIDARDVHVGHFI